jgi:hypothetical protein
MTLERREMETVGKNWKQNGRFVSNCFQFFFPQPARVREEACRVERYQKPLKTQRDITRGCWHVRQLGAAQNVKTYAESNHVGVCGGCGKVFRCRT